MALAFSDSRFKKQSDSPGSWLLLLRRRLTLADGAAPTTSLPRLIPEQGRVSG